MKRLRCCLFNLMVFIGMGLSVVSTAHAKSHTLYMGCWALTQSNECCMDDDTGVVTAGACQ